VVSPGSPGKPLRVAIIGSGPAAFYVAEHLLKKLDGNVAIDMFERLPAPFGLVRFGVAPDHQKIKNVTRVFERIAARDDFRFYGNVEYGRHVSLAELKRHYHQVCFATGAQTDRQLGIPGEELGGSHAATEFVAWYNGHPDYRECRFDLSTERVVVVGVGNVAVDVARILCRTEPELLNTDIADHALEALRESRVREIVMLGRRGPAQAAFTNPELRELGELEGADLELRPAELELDELSRRSVGTGANKDLVTKLELLGKLARRPPAGKPRRLTIRFLVSPIELHGDADGNVTSVTIVRNRLVDGAGGKLRSESTGETEELSAGLVFRSVGYRGIPLPELPFDDRQGVVPNQAGRVVGGDGRALPGVYVSGWIKRGPTGVIGTNKPDAGETAASMIEDVAAGRHFEPDSPDPAAIDALLRERQPDCVTYEHWRRLDELELSRGRACGRPRVKYSTVSEFLQALRD
jgi:ferredoxin--NADP+ reductase